MRGSTIPLAVIVVFLLTAASGAQDAPCPIGWWLHCDNDFSACVTGRFYPCANNVSWTFDFDKRGDGPNNTVLHVIIASINRTRIINAWEYLPGHNRMGEGLTPMILNYDQLTIMKWSGSGGDFENMDLRTKYENGNPTRPEGP
jgi:hypothetical protein